MKKLFTELESLENFNSAEIEAKLKNFATLTEIKYGMLINPFRLLISGTHTGPSVFHLAELLGKTKVLERMKIGFSKLS